MNTMLVVAAGIILMVGLAHSYLGERYILTRLFRRQDLPQLFGSDLFTRRTLRFAWHLTSVVWWGVALLLVMAAQSGTSALSLPQLGSVIAMTALVSGVVALVGSKATHPAWAAFFVIAALVWLGT